jgi:hypothetical protein
MKKDKKYKKKYKQLKHQVQKEQRHAYNTYIDKLILDLPTNVPLMFSGPLALCGLVLLSSFLDAR